MYDIDTMQTITSMVVCTGVSAYVGHYYLYGNDLELPLPFMVAYFLIDIFFAKKEMFLHHTLVLSILASGYLGGVKLATSSTYALVFYKTEISTIFYVMSLVLKDWVHPGILGINNALFFLTFFKFRIYDYYTYLIADTAVFEREIIPYMGHTLGNMYYVAYVGLFMLNLYWFTILSKIVAKRVVQAIQPDTLQMVLRTALSYMYSLNLPIASFIYVWAPNISYLTDITGVSILAACCYLFHSRCLEYYKRNKCIDFISDEIMPYYIMDNVGIHLRGLLASITATYYSTYWFPIILASSLMHCTSIYSLMYTLETIKEKHDTFILSESNNEVNEFLLISHTLTSIPMLFDIATVGLFSSSPMDALNLFLVTYVSGLILKINPFYDLNHAVFHLCLIIQNVFVARSNLR